MKKVRVVCGVVFNKNSEILITQRGDKENYHKWEFPGGKVKPQEELNDSIKRELFEELNILVDPIEIIFTSEFEKFQLIFIECQLNSGQIKLNEHLNYSWVTQEELRKYDFLEGDKAFIDYMMFDSETS